MAKPISVAPADVQHGLTIFSNAKIDLGIISPCFSCKNRRSQQETKKINGVDVALPACPRMAMIDAQTKNNVPVDDQILTKHLLLKGKDGQLANPIWDADHSSYWIWVARLLDNTGAYSMEGHQDREGDQSDSELCPPITARNWNKPGGYDTDFMQCMALPMVPDTTFMKLMESGRWNEGEYVLITHFQGQQVKQDRIPIPIGGLAHKLDIAGAMKFTAPKDHQGVKA